MLFLVFYSGPDLFAIDTQYIQEIVPQIKTENTQTDPDYLSGICDVHGELIPIVDFSRLVRGTPCENTFYTRTMIVTNPHSSSSMPRLGITGEKVCETRQSEEFQFTTSDTSFERHPFITHKAKDDNHIISIVDVPLLFETLNKQNLCGLN